MRIAHQPLDDQVAALWAAWEANPMIDAVLAGAVHLDLPGWYLTAGCLAQSVWNAVTGRPATHGISDYDLFYFDDTDRSYDAEDRVIRRAAEVYADLPVTVEVRNEARVHLWYPQRFGVACPPYPSTEAAIASFPVLATCVGVHCGADGRRRLYAPYGLADLFDLVLRPNPVQAPRSVYEAKAARWREHWPELTVQPWPTPAPA